MKEKITRKLYQLFLVLTIALAVVLSVVGGVRADVGGSQELALRGLSAYLEANPSSERAGKVVDVLLSVFGVDEESLGGAFTQARSQDIINVAGVGYTDPVNTTRQVKRFCLSESFPKTTSTIVSTRNNSGDNMLIDHLAVYANRAASASIVLSFGSSTVSGVSYDAGSQSTTTLPRGLADRFFIGATSGTTGYLFGNETYGTSTQAYPNAVVNTGWDTTSSSVHFDSVGVGNLTSITSSSIAKLLRVGKNHDSRLEVRPNEYFVGHLEVGEWPVGSPYRYAVTTTPSTSTLTDSNRIKVAGDIGFEGLVEYCWTQLSTSTPQ